MGVGDGATTPFESIAFVSICKNWHTQGATCSASGVAIKYVRDATSLAHAQWRYKAAQQETGERFHCHGLWMEN